MKHLQNVNNEYKEIKGILNEIKDDIKLIKCEIDIDNVKPLFTASEGFPLRTVEEFHVFEGDRNKQKKLYADLLKYGGSKLREALNIAFKASMTDKLATDFTWYGEKETKNFSTSKMASLLHRVVKKCQNFPGPRSETEFKVEMMEVLRAAKQRYRNTIVKKPCRTNRTNNRPSEEEIDLSDQEVGELESEDGSSEFEGEASSNDAGSERSVGTD